ncbi:hypothetical protein [Breoghania sp.]|uniref:hypothetical protein n=1 Tax=Breoghania sp. TaxID=2065378 RepID=UPI0029CA4646|nr:hypothetical protein [Breoghania sp.]
MKQSPETVVEQAPDTAKADVNEAATEKEAAPKEAVAEGEAPAKDVATSDVADPETRQPDPKPVDGMTEDLKPFVALCHVKMDGELKAPGATLWLNRTAFEELKKAKAVDGEW